MTSPFSPNPKGQFCSVENGSDQVPDQDVTDVAVSCIGAAGGNLHDTWYKGKIRPEIHSRLVNRN